jgi:hypothetical protein
MYRSVCECCDSLVMCKKYGKFYLCEICHSTHLGIAVLAPSQCPDVKLYKSIAWIANRLLAEIKERHNP